MRLFLTRVTLVAAALAAVAACDSRTMTSPVAGGGTGAGTSGGSGGLGGDDRTPPQVVIDTPTVSPVSLVNVGDSILVAVHLRDVGGLAKLELRGVSIRGNPDLGNAVVVERFVPLTVPPTGTFRAGLRDTVIRRYLVPKLPADTVQDSVVVMAIGTDVANNKDTATVRVNIVSGPRVVTLSPAPGDSVRPGTAVRIQVRATHAQDIGRLGVRVQGEAGWPTPLDVRVDTTVRTSARDVTFSASVLIPLNAPPRGRITITPYANDVNQVPGSASPVILFVQAGPSPLPRVTQTVPVRAEVNDTIVISAGGGDGIRAIGFEVRDSTALVRRDSIVFPAPYGTPQRVSLPLNLPTSAQGRRVTVTSFAIDQGGRYGYSVPAQATLPQGEAARAHADSAFIVYGRTFSLPRAGLAGDVVVDEVRGNVFVSNTSFNRLEVWSGATRAFDANGVAVGSEPWGMTISATDPNELLVANSGGTNISRVSIASGAASGIREDLSKRIRTRNTYIYTVTESREQETGKIRLRLEGPFSYSDRPQYIAQAASGRIYYSTRPTASAPQGTIRWLDPSLAVPDPQHISDYASRTGGGDAQVLYVLFNVDAADVIPAPANSTAWDKLVLADHKYGTAEPTNLVITDSTVEDAVRRLGALGSDVVLRRNIDVASLGLRDTTFVAASGNRNWIAFGEGGSQAAPARVMMAHDPAGPRPSFFSPGVAVSDIIENASEPVFGLALDRSGSTLGVHGKKSYFSAVDEPFHLRLQGKYDSFDQGAGIAFHPDADGVTSPEGTRVAFVASSNGTIEMMDIAYFINRGRLNIKGKLYGPLRVSKRFPGDPADVVLKVFGLTSDGLVVIDLRAADIKSGP